MKNAEKVAAILGLVVVMAKAVVTLSEVWSEIAPKVKKAVKPIIDGCKALTKSDDEGQNSTESLIEVIE